MNTSPVNYGWRVTLRELAALSICLGLPALDVAKQAEAAAFTKLGNPSIADMRIAVKNGKEHKLPEPCQIPYGKGPSGATVFFENCWWREMYCPDAKVKKQYKCVTCPDLPKRVCPPGTTVWH